MAEQKIELRKIRDFSEIISDTFVFIRQNFKALLASFLGIAGIFMLAEAIVSGMFQSDMGDVLKNIFKVPQQGRAPEFGNFAIFTRTYFLLILLGCVNLVAMKVAILAYIKLYDTKEDGYPTIQEVWTEFSRYFIKVFFFSLPVLILIVIGFLFCIVPGVYLAVVLVPFEMILMIEETTFEGAFNRCFIIIKQNFWPSIGVYFIAYLIYNFCSLIIGGFVGIIGGALSYFTTKDIGNTIGIFTSVLNIFSFVFFIVFYVAAVLNYFSLSERYDGTGMLKKLDRLGNKDLGHQHTEEQY